VAKHVADAVLKIDRMKRIHRVQVDETVQEARPLTEASAAAPFGIPDVLAPARRWRLGSLWRRGASCRARPSRF